jgi:hypothetical protein
VAEVAVVPELPFERPDPPNEEELAPEPRPLTLFE